MINILLCTIQKLYTSKKKICLKKNDLTEIDSIYKQQAKIIFKHLMESGDYFASKQSFS